MVWMRLVVFVVCVFFVDVLFEVCHEIWQLTCALVFLDDFAVFEEKDGGIAFDFVLVAQIYARPLRSAFCWSWG